MSINDVGGRGFRMTAQLHEENVVRAIARCIGAVQRWQAAILDYEVMEVSDGYDSDYVGIVLLIADGGTLTQDQFQLDRDARQACVELCAAHKQGTIPSVAGFTLRLETTGSYRFDFKQEVKRLNGVWDAEAETYFDNYLTHYQREKSAAGGVSG